MVYSGLETPTATIPRDKNPDSMVRSILCNPLKIIIHNYYCFIIWEKAPPLIV